VNTIGISFIEIVNRQHCGPQFCFSLVGHQVTRIIAKQRMSFACEKS
jgi:hypothetical protein